MDAKELRNLQEAYMEVVENQQLDEGYKHFPHDKVQAKAKKLKAHSQENVPIKDKSDKEIADISARQEKSGQRATTLNLASRTSHSGIPTMKSRLNKNRPESEKRSKTVQAQKSFPNRLRRNDGQGIRDSYDYYDIILSHLLDEGYAETPEAAEAIMVNMSEEWRDSILG